MDGGRWARAAGFCAGEGGFPDALPDGPDGGSRPQAGQGLDLGGGAPSAACRLAAGPADALALSLANLGRVDIGYISIAAGMEPADAIDALAGLIFQNPETWDGGPCSGWEAAGEYLSGNLSLKLAAAMAADARHPGRFDGNASAIRAALPEPLRAEDIHVTLGSPWVPSDVVEDFIRHLLGRPKVRFRVIHAPVAGAWKIKGKQKFKYGVESRSTYGTPRMAALDILERTLNMSPIQVFDEVADPSSATGTKRLLNQQETLMALEKQALIIREFKSWVWGCADRRERLCGIYRVRYASMRARSFDGGLLPFTGMAEGMELYPHQKAAAARIVFTRNALLAHDVGAGKTYVMAAAAMELRRMGLSSKNLFVVPNGIVGQWESVFRALYPDAKIKCVTPASFTPVKRQATLRDMRDGDCDGIIIAYSCFERIPLSRAERIRSLREQGDEILRAWDEAGRDGMPSLGRKAAAIEKRIASIQEEAGGAEGVCFDDLGVTRLFIDEAHNFKNVPIDTKVGHVLGINQRGSKRCADVMEKVRSVQRAGGGAVLATGTPITNSITDVFVLQRYLQERELKEAGLFHFDSWLGMFAQKATGFEVDVDTSSYRLATRFARFGNLPELSAMLALVADFHRMDAAAGIPETEGYSDEDMERPPGLERYMGEISARADGVRQRRVSRDADNMLKITTDGRKAALDLRLVGRPAPPARMTKVERCAQNVARIYREGEEGMLAQLVFCDGSTPKAGFNMYGCLKRRLVQLGIPEGQVAFIHDASDERRREGLYASMRSGAIRILVGSTFKLGTGVNVQDRLVAIHHLDVPWRPADMMQREGRILRQGNSCPKVEIYRYITRGSFDAYSWQILESKQRLISDLLSGSLDERASRDIGAAVLDYAEVKALAIGDPLMRERVEVANELARLSALSRKEEQSRRLMRAELASLPRREEGLRGLIGECEADIRRYAACKRTHGEGERRAIRARLEGAVRAGASSPSEWTAFAYQGFDVAIPEGMDGASPFIWLVGSGRYRVELGASDVGNLVRIDNRLDSLPARLAELGDALEELRLRRAALTRDLGSDRGYEARIEALRARLGELDGRLAAGRREGG